MMDERKLQGGYCKKGIYALDEGLHDNFIPTSMLHYLDSELGGEMVAGKKELNGLAPGRMVHFVYQGRHCAAVVTHVWGSNGTVNLHVFKDGSFPEVPEIPTSVLFDDENNLDHTWHWIEKEGDLVRELAHSAALRGAQMG